jgi:hypothetical protein
MAVATPKLSGIGLAIGAFIRFNKSHSIDWQWVRRLLPITILAGIIGPQLLFRVDSQFVEAIAVVFMLGLMPFIFVSRVGLSQKIRGRFHHNIGYGLYFIISTLKAAFGSGIGTLLMYVMMGPFGMTAIKANATKRLTGLALLIPAFLQLAWAGLIDYNHGIALFAGNIVGGWLGANIAVKKGNLLVRSAFAVAVVIGAISILLD